jgi:hypothetical protein
VKTNTANLSPRYQATVPANATNSHYIWIRLTGNLSHRCKSLLAHWLRTNTQQRSPRNLTLLFAMNILVITPLSAIHHNSGQVSSNLCKSMYPENRW